MAPQATKSDIQLDPAIFRAYDIRGVVQINLTPNVVYWIGRSFAAEALSQKQNTAVIGGDGRGSTPSLCDALAQGLNDGGVNAIDVGTVPTPLLYLSLIHI